MFTQEEMDLIERMGEEYLTNQGPNNQEDAKIFYSILQKLEFDVNHKNTTIDSNKLFSLIAGHSDYHGDSILCAISCLAEGKDVAKILPIKR